MTTPESKYNLETISVTELENKLDSIIESLGKDTTLKVITKMLWKTQDKLIEMEETKAPVEKLAVLDTEITKLEHIISSLVDECNSSFCVNPYCSCRN